MLAITIVAHDRDLAHPNPPPDFAHQARPAQILAQKFQLALE